MKILVTGADGRLGKHLTKALEKENEVIKFDRRNGYDLLDKESVQNAVKNVDLIYHLAAIVDYAAPKTIMHKVNVEGTENLAKAAGNKKIVFMSSTAVYGKKLSKIPADESTKLKPTDYYGKTKIEAEKIILKHGGIVIRSADIYGPGFEEGYFKVFEMIQNGKMMIFGKGNNRIQYVHVNDLVNALISAGKSNKIGEVYTIAGQDIKTQEELYRLIAKYLGVEPPKKHINFSLAKFAAMLKGKKEMAAYIEKLAADRVFDISKAERELGWKPKIGYEKGIKEMIELYLKNQF